MKLDLTELKAQLRSRLPAEWTARLGQGSTAIGWDQATTENELSNPSSITVMEREGLLFCQRLVLRFKSADYRIRMALAELVIDDLLQGNRRPRRLVIDATSEKAAAQMASAKFAGRVPVEFYVASQNIEEGKLKFPAKTLLSDRYREAFESNTMAMPPDSWLLSDHSLVKRQAGRYIVEEDAAGNHGDAWQSGMFALWGLLTKGERAELFTVDIRGGAGDPGRPPLPFQKPNRGGQLLA